MKNEKYHRKWNVRYCRSTEVRLKNKNLQNRAIYRAGSYSDCLLQHPSSDALISSVHPPSPPLTSAHPLYPSSFNNSIIGVGEMQTQALLLVFVALCATIQAFAPANFGAALARSAVQGQDSTALNACRRNNKMEKRKRNRDYARKFKTAGGSRKDVVIEEKRAVVAKNEDNFQALVFKMTTDDDMPAYSGFEWS